MDLVAGGTLAAVKHRALNSSNELKTSLYILSFMKIGSAIQKLLKRGIHRHTAWRLHKPTLIFFKIRKAG
jgi:hypothetical protein